MKEGERERESVCAYMHACVCVCVCVCVCMHECRTTTIVASMLSRVGVLLYVLLLHYRFGG